MSQELDKKAAVRIVGAIIGGAVGIGCGFLFGLISRGNKYDFSGLSARVSQGYDFEDFLAFCMLAFAGGAAGYWLGKSMADELYK